MMKLVPPTSVTGDYLSAPSLEQPPKELTEAMGMPILPTLKAAETQEIIKE